MATYTFFAAIDDRCLVEEVFFFIPILHLIVAVFLRDYLSLRFQDLRLVLMDVWKVRQSSLSTLRGLDLLIGKDLLLLHLVL